MRAHRFRDDLDQTWFVYAVQPAHPLAFDLLVDYRAGWLVFVCGSDMRRLAPIPDGWESLDAAALRALLPEPGVSPDPRHTGPQDSTIEADRRGSRANR